MQRVCNPGPRLKHHTTRIADRTPDPGTAHLERAGGLGDQREAPRPVVPVVGQQHDAGGVAADHHAEAVVFDFVNPAGAGRRAVGGGRQAGRNETRNHGAGVISARWLWHEHEMALIDMCH